MLRMVTITFENPARGSVTKTGFQEQHHYVIGWKRLDLQVINYMLLFNIAMENHNF